MTGRKGERAKILFDSIDLEILKILTREELSVLELGEKLELNHKNLKPHLDKLLSLNFIFPYKTIHGKIRLISVIKNVEDDPDYQFDSDDFSQDLVKKIENLKIFIEIMENIEAYNLKKQMSRDLELDLRKMKRNTRGNFHN